MKICMHFPVLYFVPFDSEEKEKTSWGFGERGGGGGTFVKNKPFVCGAQTFHFVQ